MTNVLCCVHNAYLSVLSSSIIGKNSWMTEMNVHIVMLRCGCNWFLKWCLRWYLSVYFINLHWFVLIQFRRSHIVQCMYCMSVHMNTSCMYWSCCSHCSNNHIFNASFCLLWVHFSLFVAYIFINDYHLMYSSACLYLHTMVRFGIL